MCYRLTCEKKGMPIIESCRDCLPVDGPSPEMYKTDNDET